MFEFITVLIVATTAILILLYRIYTLQKKCKTVSATCKGFKRGRGKNNLYVADMEYADDAGISHTVCVYLLRKPQIGDEYTVFLDDKNSEFAYSTEDITTYEMLIVIIIVSVMVYIIG